MDDRPRTEYINEIIDNNEIKPDVWYAELTADDVRECIALSKRWRKLAGKSNKFRISFLVHGPGRMSYWHPMTEKEVKNHVHRISIDDSYITGSQYADAKGWSRFRVKLYKSQYSIGLNVWPYEMLTDKVGWGEEE